MSFLRFFIGRDGSVGTRIVDRSTPRPSHQSAEPVPGARSVLQVEWPIFGFGLTFVANQSFCFSLLLSTNLVMMMGLLI